ncbi:MAG TPA: hypothetical protein VIH48_05340 [Candidatus Bathyarchaeia archaeon]
MKCTIRGREANEKVYCELHANAYGNIIKKYDQWKKAMGITWKEYLSMIANNPLTGEWAKEVAEWSMKNGGNEYVAES